MDHKEMSRRALAIALAWGFWLFWGVGAAGCWTADRKDNGPLGLVVLAWVFVSFFPVLFEHWMSSRRRRRWAQWRCLLEFVLILPVVGLTAGLSEEMDDIYLFCLPVMGGLTYSCFRLRHVALDYLAAPQYPSTPQEKNSEILVEPTAQHACDYH